MAIESLVAAGAQGLSNMMSQAANAASTIFGNRAQRKWNERQYDKQRRDALSDFYLQNEYNSPEQQMKRLKAAGLNPNLVYGNGNAIQNAGPIRSADTGSYRPETPSFDFGGTVSSALGAYYDTQTKEATLDNLKAQNNVLSQQATYQAAQTAESAARTQNLLTNTEGASFDIGQRKRLADTSFEIQQASLRKLNADTNYTLNQDERAAAQNATSLRKAAEEILNLRMQRAVSKEQVLQIRAQAQNLRNNSTLQELDIELKRLGINPSDPTWQRILGRVIGADSDQTPQGRSNRGLMRQGMEISQPWLKWFK